MSVCMYVCMHVCTNSKPRSDGLKSDIRSLLKDLELQAMSGSLVIQGLRRLGFRALRVSGLGRTMAYLNPITLVISLLMAAN